MINKIENYEQLKNSSRTLGHVFDNECLKAVRVRIRVQNTLSPVENAFKQEFILFYIIGQYIKVFH